MGEMLGLCFPPQPKIISKLQGVEGPGRERKFLSSGCQSREAAAHNEKCVPSLPIPSPVATSSQKKHMGLLQKTHECEAQASGSLLPFETTSLQTKIGCLCINPTAALRWPPAPIKYSFGRTENTRLCWLDRRYVMLQKKAGHPSPSHA